jgi:hypothetical protein
MVTFDKQGWSRPQFGQDFAKFVDTFILKRIPPLKRRLGRRSNPLSIFVLTDGRWGTEEVFAFRAGLNRVSDMVETYELPCTHAVFQTMRFGDDENGSKHLYTLDSSK